MRKNVLLIDDQEIIFEIFQDLLQPLGCRLTWAPSGEEGLRHLETTPCDILFIDLDLGRGISGTETLRRMHAADIRPRVYIVTGFYEDYSGEMRDLANREGFAFEILRKPLELGRIRDIVADTPGYAGSGAQDE